MMAIFIVVGIVVQIILLALAASYGYRHGYKDCADDMSKFKPPKTVIRPAGRK